MRRQRSLWLMTMKINLQLVAAMMTVDPRLRWAKSVKKNLLKLPQLKDLLAPQAKITPRRSPLLLKSQVVAREAPLTRMTSSL